MLVVDTNARERIKAKTTTKDISVKFSQLLISLIFKVIYYSIRIADYKDSFGFRIMEITQYRKYRCVMKNCPSNIKMLGRIRCHSS